MTCPTTVRLRELVELELPASEERELRSHVDGCSACEVRLRELDPAWVFRSLPPLTLGEDDWAALWREVRASIESDRSRGSLCGAGRWWRFLRWSPVGLGAAAAALLVWSLTLPKPSPPVTARDLENGGEVMQEVSTRVDEPLQRSSTVWLESAAAPGFAYLSNPSAEIAHVLVAGSPGSTPVQVTMVIDETLAESF